MRRTTWLILESVEMQLEEFRERQQSVEQFRSQIEKYYLFNQQQLQDLKTDLHAMSGENLDVDVFFEQLRRTEVRLAQKRSLLEDLQRQYAALIDTLQRFQHEVSTVLDDLHHQIERWRYTRLFERTARPWDTISLKAFRRELGHVLDQVSTLGTMDLQWEKFPSYRTVFLRTIVIFFGGLVLIQVGLLRLRRIVSNVRDTMSSDRPSWRDLLAYLIHRSLLLFGTTLYLYLFTRLQDLDTSLILFQGVFSVLMIWVSSQWVLDMFTYWRHTSEETSSTLWVRDIRSLMIGLRYGGMTYVVLTWSLGQTSALVSLGRLLIWLGVLIWLLIVKKHFTSLPEIPLPAHWLSRKFSKNAIIRGGMIIAGGGLLPDIAGYGPLAAHWFRSWALTLIVFVWGGIFWGVLQEWQQHLNDQIRDKHDRDESVPLSYRLGVFLLLLAWPVWCGLVILGLVLAWAPQWLIFPGIDRLVTYQLPLGERTIRLVDILFAFLILILTRIVTYIWRYTLQEKFLFRSNLGKGLQFSLTTLSVYLLWIEGLNHTTW
jgi:small-conductance mechanosensitive channel